MNRMIEFFDRYTKEYGWKVIPVFSRSKIPVKKKWNSNYNVDWARFYIDAHPKINLGLLLGEIVDVEGDTPAANAFLTTILAGHVHPTYKSSKSIHHLFRTPDKDLTCLKHDGLEFRGNKHYSVVPPSIHAGGAAYEWLVQPDGPIPEMPEQLAEFYNENKRKAKKVKPDFTLAPCGCGREQPIHEKRYELELKAFRHLGLAWACHKCRNVDVRELCRVIRRGR